MSAKPNQIVLILPTGLEQDILALANAAAMSRGLSNTGTGTGRDFAGAASELKFIVSSQSEAQYEKASKDDLKKQLEEEAKPKSDPINPTQEP